MPEFCVADGQKMVLIGDSITDCGRRGDAAPLGCGYVAFFTDLVTARHPERNIAFVNRGIGGNTVLELDARWGEDLIAERPDWVSCMVGINDLHRTLNGVHDLPPARYREIYDRLLQQAVDETGANLLLLDPFYMITEAETNDAQATVLGIIPGYIDVVHELAEKFDARLVRTHDMFARQLQHRPFTTFCDEPVHPNRTGHMLIAHELLKTMED
jgi:lysophospholipase L1-like esterase